jgi:hypothetical protein
MMPRPANYNSHFVAPVHTVLPLEALSCTGHKSQLSAPYLWASHPKFYSNCIPSAGLASPDVIAPTAELSPQPRAVGAVNSESTLAPVTGVDTPTGPNKSDPSVPVGVNNSPITFAQFEYLNRRST